MTGLGEDYASSAGKTVQNCDLAMDLWFPGSSLYRMGLVGIAEDEDCSYSWSFHGPHMNRPDPIHQSSNGPLHRNPLCSHTDGMWL